MVPMDRMMVYDGLMDPMMVFPYPMAIFVTSDLLDLLCLLLLFCPTLLAITLAHLVW